MRKPIPVRFCFFAVLVALVAAFGQGTSRTYADSVSIGPSNGTIFGIPGMYFNSYVTLTEAIPATPFYKSIHITDVGVLEPGWTVKVDSELMYIRQLIPGASGQPATMVVDRGQGGTVADTHTATAFVQIKAVSIDIMAQNVSAAPYGFGAFDVEMAIPAELQVLELDYDSTWLGSTGRTPDCDAPVQKSPGVWHLQCASLNNPPPGGSSWLPAGPNGTGRIARIVVMPPPSGYATIQLTGSFLLDATGQDLSAAVSPVAIRFVDCPDTNLDGKVNSLDMLNAAKNLNDKGVDSGATILNDITASQTQIAISDQSRLSNVAPNNIISIDNESMTVVSLQDGSPDIMTVTRGTNYPQTAIHKAGSHIYSATNDGNFDGKRAYTATRDVSHDGIINSLDELIIAKIFNVTQYCPTSP